MDKSLIEKHIPEGIAEYANLKKDESVKNKICYLPIKYHKDRSNLKVVF